MGLSSTACQRRAASPAPSAPQVTVAKPVSKRVVEWNVYTARLDGVESVELRPRVGGFIEAVDFREGQFVEAGQVLFELDPRPLEAELARAEARLDQARASAVLAEANLRRSEVLLRTQAIAKQEFDLEQANDARARADVRAAEAEVEAARLQVSYTKVVAPIAGVAGRHLVTKGNLVAGGQGASLLTTIVPQDPMFAYFEIDEAAFLAGVRRYFQGETPGRGRGQTPIEMELRDETGFPHRGVIDFIDNRLSAQTGTMLARGRFANPKGLLTPGQFARVRVPASQERDALLLPDSAIASDQAVRFVWVVANDSTAERRPVQLGTLVDGLRVIRDGLTPEDRVVVEGLIFVRPGAPLTVTETTIAPPDAGAEAQSPAPSAEAPAKEAEPVTEPTEQGQSATAGEPGP